MTNHRNHNRINIKVCQIVEYIRYNCPGNMLMKCDGKNI
jgi:hypothetical protein